MMITNNNNVPAPFQQPNYLAYAQQQLGFRDTVFITPEQQKAQLLATSIAVFLGLVMLPVSIFDVVAVAKAGQNMVGIGAHCGDAFYTFIVANMALNFVFCIALLMTGVYVYNLDANALQERKLNPSNNVAITLGCASGVYTIFAIAALVIVAIGMSSQACSDAIAEVSFGQPLLGIVGYINVGIDFFMLIATSGMACKFYVSTTQYQRVADPIHYAPTTTRPTSTGAAAHLHEEAAAHPPSVSAPTTKKPTPATPPATPAGSFNRATLH